MKKRKSKKAVKSKRTGRAFFICLISLVALIIIANNVLFDEKSMNNNLNSDYKGPCNKESGGIEVQGECYDCGVADKVCPEEFGANCKVIDPDCS